MHQSLKMSLIYFSTVERLSRLRNWAHASLYQNSLSSLCKRYNDDEQKVRTKTLARFPAPSKSIFQQSRILKRIFCVFFFLDV